MKVMTLIRQLEECDKRDDVRIVIRINPSKHCKTQTVEVDGLLTRPVIKWVKEEYTFKNILTEDNKFKKEVVIFCDYHKDERR